MSPRGEHLKQSARRRSSSSLFDHSFYQAGSEVDKTMLYSHSTTKMKGLAFYLNSLAFFYLVGLRVMIVNVISIEAQGLTAGDKLADLLLNTKVEELYRFVYTVEENSRNCSALMGCSSSGDGCSRLSCYKYGNPDVSNYKCVKVFNNTNLCGPTCVLRKFDYSRSYVRRVDTSEDHTVARTVCTHRTLDVQFKNSTMNDSAHFFRVFFGAVDGTTRIYPGADEDCNSGSDYDPRDRRWYTQSTNIPKVVFVLLDSGSEMRFPITGKNETYLDRAVNTALRFLDTLWENNDYVNIMYFDGKGIANLLTATSDTPYSAANLYQKFNESLAGIVSNNVKTSPDALNTTDAINTAISQLNSTSPRTFLKVLIVLTSGLQFQTLSELNISANSGVNVFVYSFRSPNRTSDCNTSIRAFSTGIPFKRQDNPLYALESYYSFLAKIHRTFYGDPINYGPPYEDYSKVDSNTLTLSKAAFGPASGELLGVVGIDIFENKFGEQYQDISFRNIQDAAQRRDVTQTQLIFDTSENLTTSVCFTPSNLTEDCKLVDTNVQDFLCKPSNSDSKIGCCDSCTTSMDSAPGQSKGTELRNILGAVAAGIGGLLVIAVIYFVHPCIARRMDDEKALAENPQFTFPGPENGTVLQGDTIEDFRLKSLG